MIGDSPSDIVAGQNAGCKTIMIEGTQNKKIINGMENIKPVKPNFKCKNLLEAAKLILK